VNPLTGTGCTSVDIGEPGTRKKHSPAHTYHVRHLLDFLMENEDNTVTGRRTNNLDELPPHPD